MSLHRRIVLGTTVTTALVTLLASAIVWMAADAVMHHAVDSTLSARLKTFEHIPPHPPHDESDQQPEFGPDAHGYDRHAPGGPRGPDDGNGAAPGPDDGPPPRRPPGFARAPAHPQRPAPPEFTSDHGTFFIQYRDADGREMARSASLPDHASLAACWSGRVMDGFQSATLPDGRWLRITHAAVSFDQGVALPPWLHAHGDASHRPEALRHVDIFLANDISRVHHDLLVLAGILAALWLVATVLSALASVYLRRAILRPIARISQIISDIGPDNLKARVASAQVPDEMHGIIDRLNGLVGRLDEAFMRERSTIANIAHELRTPVTGLSATLEFALARGAHASRDQDLRACLAMTVAMQRMIANLLTLARLESGAVAVIPTPVDAAEIMRTCLGVVQERVAEGGYRISEAISDTVRVMAGEEPLRMILGNVLDNALSYADPARPIRVSVSAVGSHAHIQVINGTDGTLTDVSQVFTPFWRGDQVRRSGQHCGLGLSLVQRQLTVFAGTVQVHLGAGHEFIVEMRVPLAATPG